MVRVCGLREESEPSRLTGREPEAGLSDRQSLARTTCCWIYESRPWTRRFSGFRTRGLQRAMPRVPRSALYTYLKVCTSGTSIRCALDVARTTSEERPHPYRRGSFDHTSASLRINSLSLRSWRQGLAEEPSGSLPCRPAHPRGLPRYDLVDRNVCRNICFTASGRPHPAV